jgi:IclR family transcriptional regulator, KDG regulon repressor
MLRTDQQRQSEDAGPVSSGEATSLLRALAILELIANRPGGLSNSEISRRLNIATSSCSYILSRLQRAGYIKRNTQRGRYEIGLKVIALTHGALREMGLRNASQPILHRIVAQTGCSGIIAVLDGGLIMIVDKVERPNLSKLDMDIGVCYPAHSTALGRVLMSHLPENELAEVFPAPGSSFKAQLFLEGLEKVKQQGYSVSDGDLFLGVWAVAAPIFDSAGRAIAAVSATGTPKPQNDSEVTQQIIRAAREISARVAAGEANRRG